MFDIESFLLSKSVSDIVDGGAVIKDATYLASEEQNAKNSTKRKSLEELRRIYGPGYTESEMRLFQEIGI